MGCLEEKREEGGNTAVLMYSFFATSGNHK